MSLRFLNFAGAFGIVVLSVYVLIIGKNLLVPLVCAVVVWYLIINLSSAYRSIPLGRWHMPRWMAMTLAVGTCILVLWAFFGLVNTSVNDVVAQAPSYEARFEALLMRAASVFQLDISNPLKSIAEQVDLGALASNFVRTLTGLAGDLGLIIVYVLFLLLEYRTFDAKLAAIAGNAKRLAGLQDVFAQISRDVNTYARIKTAIAVVTAGLSYLVMLGAGVDFASFWAVLIFLFNYIPTVGAILGVLFPMMLVVVQFDSPFAIVAVGVVLIAIPVALNNILERA